MRGFFFFTLGTIIGLLFIALVFTRSGGQSSPTSPSDYTRCVRAHGGYSDLVCVVTLEGHEYATTSSGGITHSPACPHE